MKISPKKHAFYTVVAILIFSLIQIAVPFKTDVGSVSMEHLAKTEEPLLMELRTALDSYNLEDSGAQLGSVHAIQCRYFFRGLKTIYFIPHIVPTLESVSPGEEAAWNLELRVLALTQSAKKPAEIEVSDYFDVETAEVLIEADPNTVLTHPALSNDDHRITLSSKDLTWQETGVYTLPLSAAVKDPAVSQNAACEASVQWKGELSFKIAPFISSKSANFSLSATAPYQNNTK